jgi:glutathione synthase/RimK-type ligase-like ATP-grasp enzyme
MSTHRQGPIAIATCTDVVGVEPEDLAVISALRAMGIDAVHAAWDDSAVEWGAFALVVVRSTWDYPRRRDAFLAWARQLPAVLNPWPILQWNTDKRYLDHLARVGLPVVPTQFLGVDEVFVPPQGPFVIEPAVSCGAKDTARFRPDDLAPAHEHVFRLHASGRTVMIQPYLPEIEAQGEVAVMFIGGEVSHSIRRGALLQHVGLPDDAAKQPLQVRAYEATTAERSLAERVLSQVPGGPSALLYARVDLIPGNDGQPMLLEVELTEPSLFLDFSLAGAQRLAECIAARLEQLGQ